MVKGRTQQTTYSIRLDPETRAKLLLLSKARGISFAEVTKGAVDLLFKQQEKRIGPVPSNMSSGSHLSGLLKEIVDVAEK